MYRDDEDPELVRTLREGLESVPVSELSAQFDSRVFAGLSNPDPWWQVIWNSMQPALAPAACMLAVTLTALATTGLGHKTSMVAGTKDTSVARHELGTSPMTAEQRLDRIDLYSATAASLWMADRKPIAPAALEHRADATPEKQNEAGAHASVPSNMQQQLFA